MRYGDEINKQWTDKTARRASPPVFQYKEQSCDLHDFIFPRFQVRESPTSRLRKLLRPLHSILRPEYFPRSHRRCTSLLVALVTQRSRLLVHLVTHRARSSLSSQGFCIPKHLVRIQVRGLLLPLHRDPFYPSSHPPRPNPHALCKHILCLQRKQVRNMIHLAPPPLSQIAQISRNPV